MITNEKEYIEKAKEFLLAMKNKQHSLMNVINNELNEYEKIKPKNLCIDWLLSTHENIIVTDHD